MQPVLWEYAESHRHAHGPGRKLDLACERLKGARFGKRAPLRRVEDYGFAEGRFTTVFALPTLSK